MRVKVAFSPEDNDKKTHKEQLENPINEKRKQWSHIKPTNLYIEHPPNSIIIQHKVYNNIMPILNKNQFKAGEELLAKFISFELIAILSW